MITYRILIVDDEPYVVDWIFSLLEEQENLPLEVCKAYSATEALVWLSRAKIDILLTDIQMPGMSGLELAGKVREDWPNCKVMMLTAYSEFEYAYKAVQNNVISYILKSESDAYILEQVQKTIDILNQELKQKKEAKGWESQIQISNAIEKHEVLKQWLKESYEDKRMFTRKLVQVGIKSDAKNRYLLIAKENTGEIAKMEEVRQLTNRYIGNYGKVEADEIYGDKIVWLWQGNKRKENIQTLIRGSLESVQQYLRETEDIEASFVVTAEEVNGDNISVLYQTGCQCLRRHIGKNTGFVLSFGIAESKKDDIFEEIDEEIDCKKNIRILRNCLEEGKEEEYFAVLSQIGSFLGKVESWNNSQAQEIYFSVALVLLQYINQHHLTSRLAFRIGLRRLMRPWQEDSWKNTVLYLKKISEILFSFQEEEENQLTNSTISFIKKYIKENLTGDVSLVRLSEVTGYNTSYLSRLFSEQTGETMNKYIARKKLEKIIELMRDSSLTIGDISEQVGFEYQPYFSRFIKRLTGKTPQKLREELLKY